MSDKGDSTDYNYNERIEIARKQQQMYWDAIKYENKFKEQMTDPTVIAEQEQILEDINKSKALQDDDETPVPRKGTKKCEKESDDDADDNKSTKGRKSKAPSKQEDQGTVPAKPKSSKHTSSEKPHDSNEDNGDDASPIGVRGRKSKAHSKHEKEDQGAAPAEAKSSKHTSSEKHHDSNEDNSDDASQIGGRGGGGG